MAIKVPAEFSNPPHQSEANELFVDKTCRIDEEHGFRCLELEIEHPWSEKITALARKYKVNGLVVHITAPWKNKSLDFLSKLPDLVFLNLITRELIPWHVIESLSKLKELALSSNSMMLGNDRFALGPAPEPSAIDFTKMKSLRHCRMNWSPTWASLLKVKRLRSLEIGDAFTLPELDCTALECLEKLTIAGAPKLRRIALHDRTPLKRLYLNNVTKLNADWPRLARDLDNLTIVGKMATPWEDLRHAKNLRNLVIFGVNKFGSAQFLKELPKLYSVTIESSNLSTEDRALIGKINEQARADWKKRQAAQEKK
jgi:hypothetical protein